MAQGVAGWDPEVLPVQRREPARMLEAAGGGDLGDALPGSGIGLDQLLMRPRKSDAAQVCDRRRVEVSVERGLESTTAQVSRLGDVRDREVTTGARLDEGDRAPDRRRGRRFGSWSVCRQGEVRLRERLEGGGGQQPEALHLRHSAARSSRIVEDPVDDVADRCGPLSNLSG